MKTEKLTFLLFAFLAGKAAAAGDIAQAGRSRVMTPKYKQAILIVLDAARSDHFSCYGYSRPTTPEIDRLAARGAVFETAYSPATETRAALPRMLYSRYFIPEIFPNHHSIPYASPGDLFRKIDDRAISLPRVLEARGVVTAAISAHEWITEETPFAREFAFLFDLQSTVKFDRKYAYPRADKVVDKAIEWIGNNRRRDYFLYLHVMDTHFPHYFEEDARSFFGPGTYGGNAFHETGVVLDPNREPEAADKKYLDALYDGGLRYADREIGRLIAALKRWGRLDETLIVITADHGEYLLDRKGYANHGGPWYEPLARIPLIVHYPPEVAPEKRGGTTGSVDIAPTVLALLGIPAPSGKSFDGTDLFGAERTEGTEGTARTRPAFAEGGIRDGRYKLVFKRSGAAGALLRRAKETGAGAKAGGGAGASEEAGRAETGDGASGGSGVMAKTGAGAASEGMAAGVETKVTAGRAGARFGAEAIAGGLGIGEKTGAGAKKEQDAGEAKAIAAAIAAAGVELYDVEADPRETRDLATERMADVRRMIAAYQEKLRPLYERFIAATTHDQPRFSFAVSAPAFGKDAAAIAVPVEENPEALMRIEAASGWLSRSSWDNSWLFAKPGARPLKISIPVPKGKYFVVADVWGAAELEIDGRVDGPKVELREAGTRAEARVGAGSGGANEAADAPGANAHLILRRGPKPVDIGVVDIGENERFIAVITPTAGTAGVSKRGWFAVRYFGFDPVINGKRAGSIDPERERRLRSLGYIK